jgi:hypothetical protein
MKTLIIYNDIENPLRYIIIEGDYSRWNDVTVNAVQGTGFEREFCDWMWHESGVEKHDSWSTDVSVIESKQWDKVAVCTFLP